MLRLLIKTLAAVAASVLIAAPPLAGIGSAELPNAPGSIKLAVIGDNGTGDREQYEVAQQMAAAHRRFAFALVLMLGDNFYGSQRPADLARKFDIPYKPLLDAGVKFHAALGNHDEPHTVNYPPLNMGGRRYYTLSASDVRVFVLDTNSLDPAQLRWLEAELQATREPWKIGVLHHPIYGNARRHGSALDLRVILEPLFRKYGVNVVFSGHDHVYERLKPQHGIHYFVSGAGGKLRKGDLAASPLTAAGFDRDQSFMLVEIDGDLLSFETIARTGAVVDSGTISRNTVRTGT
jgi:predicted MPP superfamily phosphohydrolase